MSRPEPQSESRLMASVDKLRHEFDRWIDAAVVQGGRALDNLGLRGADKPWYPAVDVLETADSVLVFVDLPGVDAAAVDVSVAGNMLTFKGEKAQLAAGGAEGTVHTRERTSGPFERSIPLPAAVDVESASAEARDGVIRFRFTKTSPSKARPIQIAVRRGDTPPPV